MVATPIAAVAAAQIVASHDHRRKLRATVVANFAVLAAAAPRSTRRRSRSKPADLSRRRFRSSLVVLKDAPPSSQYTKPLAHVAQCLALVAAANAAAAAAVRMARVARRRPAAAAVDRARRSTRSGAAAAAATRSRWPQPTAPKPSGRRLAEPTVAAASRRAANILKKQTRIEWPKATRARAQPTSISVECRYRIKADCERENAHYSRRVGARDEFLSHVKNALARRERAARFQAAAAFVDRTPPRLTFRRLEVARSQLDECKLCARLNSRENERASKRNECARVGRMIEQKSKVVFDAAAKRAKAAPESDESEAERRRGAR